MNTIKIFKSFLVLFAITSLGVNAQNFQGTILHGGTSSSLLVAMKPGSTLTNAQMSSAQLTILVPTTIGAPPPTVSIKNNYITGMDYIIVPTTEITTDGNYYAFEFDGIGGATVPSVTYTAGVEYNLLEIQFSGRPDVTSQVRLAQLPGGGTTSNDNFYLAMNGTDIVNQAAQFYGTGATSALNDGQGYNGYSYAAIGNVVLPLKWLNFSAVRQNSDVAVNWGVTDEESITNYELEVSTNGNTFTGIVSKDRTAGNGSKNYNYLDKQVSHYNSNILYYRVKENELTGSFTYSPVKTVRLDTKGEISLYPNPARDGFTLSVPYLMPDQKRIQLQLVNAAGQVLERKDITRLQATNYYYNLAPSIVSGEYLLKIYEDGTLTDTKQVLIKR